MCEEEFSFLNVELHWNSLVLVIHKLKSHIRA